MFLRTFVAGMVLATTSAGVFAQEKVINLYSARHYQTDEALYGNFTKATGIKINRVDADDAGILARLKSEGTASPADVILLVDAARLWRGENDGLFQPVKSGVLESRIPANLRGKDDGQGSQWFGFSTRARVIVYNKQNVKPEDVDSYESLADPKNKGKLCTRSGSHPYNVSLFGALYEHVGEAKTEAILKGMVANMARTPVGGDTDQIKAVASGECGVAISNSYYVARLMKSTKPEDIAVVSKFGVVWPNQKSFGAHVNIAGAGVAKNAPHKADAVKFLEYLASDDAQRYFAEGNNEWPAVKSVKTGNAALDTLGPFKAEVIDVAVTGRNQQKVLQILDRVGYK
ncbi:ABC-type Fe3+ transport system, periplasmic component [Herbaspirillum sp. CF444]|uniref:Fe(3+) ABC transporter substrate-binding protein n=1 Tax=Herbaspirillum sp. CF444 TaxID=1144319 RepID=UPI000272409D|nr:Fe(3+) ABC transporter substrate-binding protein [Herbaspirillum sp. CF444]EJL81175.1 ABC-type Fe3+ transport system, periplasmic component [Herbaspirillum sp. CF444]